MTEHVVDESEKENAFTSILPCLDLWLLWGRGSWLWVSWWDLAGWESRPGRLARSLTEIALSGPAPIPAGETFPEPYSITWLNPPVRLDAEQRRFLKMAAKKTIVWGELPCQSEKAAMVV